MHPFYKFRIAEHTPLGRAMLATAPIVEGEIICKLAGPTITWSEYLEKYSPYECNPLQIEKDVFVDLLEPFVYVNHSCDPNAGVRNDGILFALRPIATDEEITFDYSTSVNETHWSMECQCGSPNCRGVITDFQSIPHDRKEYYREKGALLGHILRLYY